MSPLLAEVLAAIGGIGVFGSLGAIIWLAYKYISISERNQKLESDALVAANLRAADGAQISSLASALAAKTIQWQTEKDLRVAAEAQRNESWTQGVQHAVDEINRSGIADAARLGGDIMQRALSAVRSATAANSSSQGAGVPPAGTAGTSK